MQYSFVVYDAFIIDEEVNRIENVLEEIFPDVSNMKFEKKRFDNEIFSLLEVTGTMRIFGTDYQTILAQMEAASIASYGFGIDFYENGVKLGVMYFDPYQTIDYDKREFLIKVKFETHYSKLLRLYNEKYNIAGNQITSRNFTYINQTFIEEIEVSFANQIVTGYLNGGTGDVQYDIPQNGSDFTNYFDPSDPIGNWTLKTAVYTVNGNPNCTTYDFDISGTATFWRYWRFGRYEGSTAKQPPGTPSGTSGWQATPFKVIRVGDTDYPVYLALITAAFTAGTPVSGSTPCNWLVTDTVCSNSTTLSTTSVVYTDILKRLDDTITYLIGLLDSRIQIDTTGTSTDTYYGFKNYTGETIQGSNKPFENLCIVALQNFIPDTSGPSPVQKSNLASRMLIVFKELMDELREKFGFYWFIEDRTGTPYLRIYHKTQISLLTNNPYIGDLKGYDYQKGLRRYEYEEAEYYKLINRQIAGNREFIGTEFNNRLFRSGEIKEITSSEYFYDMEDIFDNGPVNYDDASNTAWILVCCWIDTGPIYKVRKSTGFLNNMEINNGELAWTNVIDNLLVEIPFYQAEGNDVSIINIAANRQRKRRQLTLELPIVSVNDFDSTSYLELIEGDAEIDSVISDSYKNKTQLKVRI